MPRSIGTGLRRPDAFLLRPDKPAWISPGYAVTAALAHPVSRAPLCAGIIMRRGHPHASAIQCASGSKRPSRTISRS